MTTDKPKAPRKTPVPRAGLTFRQACAAEAIGGLVASQAEHILHDHRPDYEKAVRTYCRVAFEIADEMVRRDAA